jgi:hypothetical protein
VSRRDPDDAVSRALDHFQNRYYRLNLAACELLNAWDDRYGRVDGAAWAGPNLDAAVKELRRVVQSS